MDSFFSVGKISKKGQTYADTVILFTEQGTRAASIVQKIIHERLGIRIPLETLRNIDTVTAFNRIILIDEDELDSGLLQIGVGFPGVRHQLGTDGFRMGTTTKNDNRYFIVSGAGRRGIIHGVGAMLRAFRYYEDRIEVPWACLSSSPVHEFRSSITCPHRQDQGYKWWSEEMWQSYLEDLQLWGANVVMYIPLQFGQRDELIWVEGTENAKWWEPMRRLPEIAKSMDMEVGAYMGINDVFPSDTKKFPAVTGGESVYNTIMTEEACICPSVEGAQELILERREELFSKLPHLDYLYVPTTDYGGCGCDNCKPYLTKVYLPLYRKIADLLRKYHPEAKIILSNQWVNTEGMREIILPLFGSEEGKWADIMCLGAGSSSANLADMLDLLPADRQRIVIYPEITMTDGWGTFGFTPFIRNYNFLLGYGMYPEGKVTGFPWDDTLDPTHWNGPRKVPGFDFGTMGSAVIGSYTYSEGLHDDLTKIVWLANNWTPGADNDQVALDYCRYYFGEESAQYAFRLVKKLEERSVRRCLELISSTDWDVPVNACYSGGLEELVNSIDSEASQAEVLMPQWAKEGWRWKLIKFRVVMERIGLAVEKQAKDSEMESLKDQAIALARELFKDAGVTLLSRMLPDYDPMANTVKYEPLTLAVRPEWSDEMNRHELEKIIKVAREYRKKREGMNEKQV